MRVFETILDFVLVRAYFHFLGNFDKFIDVLTTQLVLVHNGLAVDTMEVTPNIQSVAIHVVGFVACRFW